MISELMCDLIVQRKSDVMLQVSFNRNDNYIYTLNLAIKHSDYESKYIHLEIHLVLTEQTAKNQHFDKHKR